MKGLNRVPQNPASIRESGGFLQFLKIAGFSQLFSFEIMVFPAYVSALKVGRVG